MTLCVHFPVLFFAAVFIGSNSMPESEVGLWTKASACNSNSFAINKSLQGFEYRCMCAEFVGKLSIRANTVILRSWKL